ncbi:hypothetical protein NHF50_05740 [Flavobacterium sp. NRK F10]|uniref:hypothetical protein n=1 Tax=Flavobacterium sp. NRK F10 TaxID=2954931 RepID=UPI0020904F19|nr:hypothetical protein [Flavobacterium sp. NRK F10]MCO6174540.1 hypothetical protein [Flavobacterium sp. NRK F10]
MFQLNKIILLLLIALLGVISFSCKPLYNLSNGVNKSIDYTTKEDYLIKIKEKYNLDTENIVFVDSLQKNDFINYIIEEKVAYIYGIVVNRKLKIDNDFIQENNSCYSRVTNLIKNNPDLIGEKLVPTKILDINYINSKNELIKLEGNKILLFIFSTKLGTSIINDIKGIMEEFKTNEKFKSYNYYLISID